jgi:hypothetical protein
MAATIKNLYEGQLPNAKTALYTVPGATTAVVLVIISVNTDGSARTMNLYYKKSGGTSRRLIPNDMPINSHAKATVEEKITMGAGDAIEGDASLAGVIDTVISGVERT